MLQVVPSGHANHHRQPGHRFIRDGSHLPVPRSRWLFPRYCCWRGSSGPLQGFRGTLASVRSALCPSEGYANCLWRVLPWSPHGTTTALSHSGTRIPPLHDQEVSMKRAFGSRLNKHCHGVPMRSLVRYLETCLNVGSPLRALAETKRGLPVTLCDICQIWSHW